MKARESLALSDAHKQGIRITLVFVDEMLYEVEQWARGREFRSQLYEEVNTLSQEQRELLLTEVGHIRKLLGDLRESLGLESERRSACTAVHSLSCAIWPHLEELKGKHLKRYGDIPQEIEQSLSESVDQLIEATKRIAEIARGSLSPKS